jgi:hypothetical protein
VDVEVEAADDRVKLQMATKVQIFYTSYLTSITASLHTHERMPRQRKNGRWRSLAYGRSVLQSSACSIVRWRWPHVTQRARFEDILRISLG